MADKFIKEQVYRVLRSGGEWQCYSASNIEDAIKMCIEEYPKCEIYGVEFVAHTKRSKTKTITIDV